MDLLAVQGVFVNATVRKHPFFGAQLSLWSNLLEKTLMLGKIEGGRRGQQRMRWLDGTIDSMDMSLSELKVETRKLVEFSSVSQSLSHVQLL